MADMMGVTPVFDMNQRNDGYGYGDGMWGGGCWMWVFFLFIIFAWGGNGWNNNGWGNNADMNGALTRAELTEGFNNQSVMRKLDGITNGLCDGFYAQNTTALQGFNGIQRDLCQGFSGITATVNQNFANTNSQIAQLGYQMQNCCCETNRNIDALRYDAQKNTCEITNAIHCEAEATRALINANTMQELRDRLEARDRDLLAANFQISQQTQTSDLINQLKPCAIPAYITDSPYTAYNPFMFNNGWNNANAFNNGCGCGCNC